MISFYEYLQIITNEAGEIPPAAATTKSPKKNYKALEGIPQHEINFYAAELDQYEKKGIVGIDAAKDIVRRFGNDASWLLKYFNYNA
jgi:hypothetical protein